MMRTRANHAPMVGLSSSSAPAPSTAPAGAASKVCAARVLSGCSRRSRSSSRLSVALMQELTETRLVDDDKCHHRARKKGIDELGKNDDSYCDRSAGAALAE